MLVKAYEISVAMDMGYRLPLTPCVAMFMAVIMTMTMTVFMAVLMAICMLVIIVPVM